MEIGLLIRRWRHTKGKSQLELALEAGISSRHLSFVETGRAKPSREMVLLLASSLQVPLREQNVWLEAAGFAAMFRETPIDAPQMSEVRAALQHLLDSHMPNAALVVDRRYSMRMANEAAKRVIAFFAPGWSGGDNLLELMLSPQGLRPALVNFEELAAHVVHGVVRELSSSARSADDDAFLTRAIEAEKELPKPVRRDHQIVVPIQLERAGVSLDLFTAITTLGTPLDITLQEIRIETLFPASAAARETLRKITSEVIA
jgi:transcriptional regulator with XRE-family HTH domain